MKARILSVSDDPGLLRTRQLLLEHAGYEVVSAASSIEAMGHRDQRFDLIILGYTLHAEEQQNVIGIFRSYGSNVPVLVMLRPGQKAIREATAGIEPAPALLLDTVKQLIGCSASSGE